MYRSWRILGLLSSNAILWQNPNRSRSYYWKRAVRFEGARQESSREEWEF
jgi:hypothetical protein